MSLLSAVPECVEVAAADLSSIGSTIEAANAAAAGPITAIAPPATDSVSAQLAALFTGQAQSYQAVSAQAATYHQSFAQSVRAAGTAYAEAEAGNAAPLQTSLRGALGAVPAGQKALGPLLLKTPGPGLGNCVPPWSGPTANATLPFFHQILLNQVNYWHTFVAALKTGNLQSIVGAFENIVGTESKNLSSVVSTLTDFSWFFNGSLVHGLELGFSAPLALMLDAAGAPFNALMALKDSASALVSALHCGDFLGALSTIAQAPAQMANAFLYGQTMLDLSLPITFSPLIKTLEVDLPMGGLLAPLRGGQLIINGGNPTPLVGTPLGGLFKGMRAVGLELADLIGAVADA